MGSIFDIKERLYRDYGQLLTSNTKNITITQLWQGGLEVNVTLLVIDPIGRIAYAHNITVPQGMDNIVVSKVHLAKPMLPGRWEAILLYQNVLVAKTTYPVLPEMYYKRVLPPSIHTSYNFSPYKLTLREDVVAFYQKIIDEDTETKFMTGDKLQNILEGDVSSLLSWTDELVNEFWKPNAACSLDRKDKCDLIPFCNETDWSSFSSDPKSELGPINPQSGKITQLIGR